MATHQASTAVPIVKRGLDGNTVFDANALKRLIDVYCDKQSKYTVVSIIGAQSSGKSTLMNAMFKTQFQMLNQQKDGRKTTTEGIWAAVCSNPRAIVFDIEGSDGLEHQDDLHARFENQSALFALEISDVVFFNINVKDMGRMHAASIPLLRTSFQERRNHGMDKTKLVIAVRDFNKKKASTDILSKQILSTLYREVMGNEMQTISVCFEPSVEFFPNLEYEEEAFQQKCEDMIPKFFFQGRKSKWAVDGIPTLGKKLWDSIRNNERLDMPSYWTIISKERCGAFKTGIISNLHTNKDYQSLTSMQHPRDFDKSVQKLLIEIKKQYDDKAQNHYGKIATDVKKTLENEIIQKVEPEFRSVMERFWVAQLNEAANEILQGCVQHVRKHRHAQSVVSKYIKKFNDETAGLSYDVDMYQKNFKRGIEVIGDALANEAKKKLLLDILKGMSVLTASTIVVGGTVGICLASVGPQSFATLPAAISTLTQLYGLGVKAIEESDAAYRRSKDKVVSEVIDDEKGSDQVAHSGASSSSSK